MDPDLDGEFELEDFMCIDEEEDTNEPSTSGAELSHRRKDFESDKDERCDRRSEALNHSTNWRTTSHAWHSRYVPRNSSYQSSSKRSNDPLLMERHPDFDAFLKRRNGKLEEIRVETTNREETRPDKRQSEPIERKRDWAIEVGSTENINEDVTLEEVDCCDSDEESVCDIICESNGMQAVGADKSKSDDHGLPGSESFKHGGIGDLATHDDPLLTYEEDWPDLLGEVDEEAVRKAANEPITIESNLTLIVPQLSSNNERQDCGRSSRGDERLENRASSDTRARSESKRNEDRSGMREEKKKQLTKAERVTSLRTQRRHTPCTHQHHRSREDLGPPFEPPYRQEQHQLRPHFQKHMPSFSSTELSQRHESNIRKHRSYPSHNDERSVTHRSPHGDRGAEVQWGSGGNSTKKMIAQKAATEHAVNSARPETVTPLPHMNASNSSKETKSRGETLQYRCAISPVSSHVQKPPPSIVESSGRTSRSAVFVENHIGTSRREDLRHSFDSRVARRHATSTKSEYAVILGRNEHNGRCFPKSERHATEMQAISSVVPAEEVKRQIGASEMKHSSGCRTSVKPPEKSAIKKASQAQKLADDAARLRRPEQSAVHPSAGNAPLISSTRSANAAIQEAIPTLDTTEHLTRGNAVKAIIFRKEADTKPFIQSHLSITFQRHGDESRNVSHAFHNASCASSQKEESGNAAAISAIACKHNVTFTSKSLHKEETRDMPAANLEHQLNMAQHSKIVDEGLAQAKKPRWTITNSTRATSSLADITSSPSSNDEKQEIINGRTHRKDSAYKMMASVNTVALSSSGGGTRRQIKLRLPSLSTA